VRVTSAGDGLVAVDGASDGRGAWLCRDGDAAAVASACLESALSRRAFARAWRREITGRDQVAIRECLGRLAAGDEYGDEHPDAH
jgi:predicted RNA-binding protein YlxR (DUF448 family)